MLQAGHVQIRDGQTAAYLGSLMAEPRRRFPGLAKLRGKEAEAMAVLVPRLARVEGSQGR